MKARAYRDNWGDAHLVEGDIQGLSTADLPGAPDLVWGSSPCQDVSLAGAYAGLSGARSGMFWPFFDLVRGLKREGRGPSIIVLENVAGLVSSNAGRDFAAVAQAFADEDYRFGAMVIDAAHWVPQSRPRFFLVALAPGATPAPGALTDGPTSDWHPPALVRAVAGLEADVARRWIWWTLGPRPYRRATLADILETDPADAPWRTRAQTAEIIAMMAPHQRVRFDTLVASSRKDGTCVAGTYYRRTRNGVQRVEARFDGLAGCLRTPSGGSSRQSVIVIDRGRVRTRLLSRRETARLMGLPDSYRLPENYNDAYHVAGDGVAAPVVRALKEAIFEPTLAATAAASLGIAAE
jgi:DNA (cytosine-5)-methyltransferase 1